MFKKNILGSFSVLRIRCFFTPRIRDPGWSNGRIRIRDKQTKFVNSLYTKMVRVRDPVLFYPPDQGSGSGMEQWSDPDPGSGIKHPGSATLVLVLATDIRYCISWKKFRHQLRFAVQFCLAAGSKILDLQVHHAVSIHYTGCCHFLYYVLFNFYKMKSIRESNESQFLLHLPVMLLSF
jgi:hypothetical protein